MSKRFQAGLLIGSVSALLILFLWMGDLFVRLRLQLNDVYFLDAPVSDTIVLVAIDDASLEAYGRTPVEWSRRVFADLVRILGEAQARVVAFDILFAQPTPDDEAFADAIREARAGEGRTRFLMPLVGVERLANAGYGSVRFEQVLQPASPLADAVDYLGFANAFTDTDDTVRRQLSAVSAGTLHGYGIGLTTFLAYLRIPSAAVDQVVVLDGENLTIASEHRIPVDARGLWRQNFFAPASSGENGFTTVSLRDVVEGRVDPALFDGKIVLIGLMNSVNAPDERATPVTTAMAGVEIHAQALETLLRGIPLTEQTRGSEALTIFVLSMVSSLLYIHLRWYLMPLVTVKLIVVWAVFAFISFSTAHTVMNLFHPFLAVVLPLIGCIGWQIASEISRRRSAEHWLAIIQRQKELLETVLGGSPSGIAVLDRYGCMNSANRAFIEAFKLEKISLKDTHFSALMQGAALAEDAREKLDVGIQGNEAFQVEFKHQGKTFMVNGANLPTDERWVLVFHDVSALAELSEIKTHMIRMLSHDLKNPLASVLGFSELMQHPTHFNDLTETHQRFVENIRRSAKSMLTIIDETLSMEQLRSGRMRKKPINLAEQIRQVCRSQQSDVEQHLHTLTLDLAEDVPPILGDSFQMGQAIINLLSNAIKYTPDGGKIVVRLRRMGDMAQIIVEDNGYGMAEAAQANLFKDFYRADATAHIRGTGLGLSLVKAITEAHGGTVSVVSAEGVGSTFTLELPLALAVEDIPA